MGGFFLFLCGVDVSIQTIEQASQLKEGLLLAYQKKDGVLVSPLSIWRLCLSILNRDPRLFCATRWQADKLIGFLIMQKSHNWLSDEVLAQELSLFVLPEYRGLGYARELIEEGMAWAKQINAKMIYTTADDETKTLADKIGFKQYGYGYYKEV